MEEDAKDKERQWNLHDALSKMHAAAGFASTIRYFHKDIAALAETVEGENGELLRTYIHHAQEQTEHLISALKSATRYQTLDMHGQVDTFRIGDIISEQVNQLQSLFRQDIIYTVENNPRIRAHHDNIERVIVNLLANAATAMETAPGTLHVVQELVTEEPTCAPIGDFTPAWPKGPLVCVRIKDEGTGIPSEKLERLLQGDYRDPGRGARSGLEYCVYALGMDDGRLCIDTVHQEGTTVHLYLPEASA